MRNRRKSSLGSTPSPGKGEGERILPVPSALDGRRYRFIESTSPMDGAYVERQPDGTSSMRVPVGSSDADRRIRLHEMAHVRWSPLRPNLPDGLSPQTMQAVEDRRMHKRLDEIGYREILRAPICPDGQTISLQGQTPHNIARAIAASQLTGEEASVCNAAHGAGHGWIVSVVKRIMKENGMDKRRPAFQRTIEAGLALDAFFREYDAQDEDEKYMTSRYEKREGKNNGWGRMEIVHMPLVDRLPRSMKCRRNRATDTGAVPRSFHRIPIDGRVFTSRVNRPAGGTVLIDQSGSMGLDPDEVMQLIAAYPGVTVATYAGRDTMGELRIIAKNGRRASDEDCYHPFGQNVIDGPALDWLASMPAPRVWVSDGYVTGSGESVHPELLADARSKVKAGRIIQIADFATLIGRSEDE